MYRLWTRWLITREASRVLRVSIEVGDPRRGVSLNSGTYEFSGTYTFAYALMRVGVGRRKIREINASAVWPRGCRKTV